MGHIENIFKQIMEKNVDSDAQLASYNTSIRNLEVQMGQISQALNSRPKGALPSDTVVNPKGGNNTGHTMAVTIRSGRVRIDIDDTAEETQEDMNLSGDHVIDIPEMVVQKAKVLLSKPPPPYPQRLAKKNGENQFKKFIDMMKILSINVPLVEALEKISGYAKFMKDLVTKKRSMNYETIKVTHQVSEIVHSMAQKLEDPGAFTILCTVGSAEFEKSLCDLGASINLMPHSVFKTLGIRPFLAMGKALIDVEAGVLTFRMGDEKVIFHVCKSMRQLNSNEVCSFVDLVTDVIIDDTSATINVGDMLEAVLLNFNDDEMDGFMECVDYLQGMGSHNYAPRKLFLDLENSKTPPTKPSIEEPPILELKPLTPYLRYEFLGSCSTLPVILSSWCLNLALLF
ncbi:uncharacterized protein [Nicotiana tomentosiformis]|uniref:uncharacterized protein n=1 Tax=Nicotiana tomentosiformis TaxID=4098 RepID=UPI00388CA3B5